MTTLVLILRIRKTYMISKSCLERVLFVRFTKLFTSLIKNL